MALNNLTLGILGFTRYTRIFHSNIFFYVKLFPTIIVSWNSLKCILWYLLELSDPFIKNENSVLPIWLEKNFEQKITFVSWKYGLFLKKRKPIFSIKLGQRLLKSFSQLHVKNSRFFLLYFLKTKRLAKDIRRPKAADSPLLTTEWKSSYRTFNVRCIIIVREWLILLLLEHTDQRTRVQNSRIDGIMLCGLGTV